jgi:predicted acyl esterase
VTFTPVVVDVDPSEALAAGDRHLGRQDAGAVVSATRGFLDSRYRYGLGRTEPVRPGRPFGMTVVEKPLDYTFRKGHVIGLNVSTEIAEWTVPKPYPCATASCPSVELNWAGGGVRLILPVVEP